MGKGKPRWERLSTYEIAKRSIHGTATPAETEAVKAILAALRQGVKRPQIMNTPNGIIVR